MWLDPIVKETRELRKQYASGCNNDADKIFEDIVKRQGASTRKRVAFPARKPKSEKMSHSKKEQVDNKKTSCFHDFNRCHHRRYAVYAKPD